MLKCQYQPNSKWNSPFYEKETIYSEMSLVRVIDVSLARLFRTHSGVPNKKNPIAADIIMFEIILGEFLFYVENSMLCVLIKIASMRRF